jgi:hypothetical protein
MKWKNNKSKCMSEKMIQMYIDNEIDTFKKADMEKHFAECENCNRRLYEYRKMISDFKESISLVNTESIEIPEFKYEKTPLISRKKPPTFYWKYAAAVILFALLLFIYKKIYTGSPNDIRYVIYDMNGEVDANKPWHEQSMSIYIIDESGRKIEHIIDY